MTLDDHDILDMFDRSVRPMRPSLVGEVVRSAQIASVHGVPRASRLVHDSLLEPTDAVPPHRRRSAAVLVAAGAVLIAGLAAITREPPDEAPSATTPTVLPTTDNDATGAVAVILAPPPNGDIELVAFNEREVFGAAGGALMAPDGTVFSVGVSPLRDEWIVERQEWETTPEDRRGLANVAGYEVAAIVDATAPTQVYRLIRDECWSIGINTAGESMFSDDLAALLQGLIVDRATGVDDAAVKIDLPKGWRSLGGARMQRSWRQQLRVEVDGEPHEVELVQVPNAPIGYVLGGETNPRPFEHGAREWWQIDVATTPGITTVAGDGVATFTVTSDLSAEQLVAIMDLLVPTAVNRITPEPGASSPVDIATVESAPATLRSDCGDIGAGIEIDDSEVDRDG